MIAIGYKDYVSAEAEAGILNFKYKGGSDSILYQYLWSPMTEWIVQNVVPEWVAPNLITLVAYLLVISSHLIMVCHSPDMQSPLPPWVLIYGGFTVLAYQILDNMDGKQARKTNNSSPLGMLFDHGCDSSTTWVLGLSHLCVMGLGMNLISVYAVLIANFICFYMGMWS